MLNNSLIVAAKRTPIGSFQGILSPFSAPELGAKVFENIIQNFPMRNSFIDEVIMGNVLSAGLGQAPARQAAIFSGISNKVPSLTINKMCGSGLKAIMLADRAIKCQDAHVVLAGGMESMSNTPFLLSDYRAGKRLGHTKIIDSMLHDGLWDVYNNKHMGNCAEKLAKKRKFSREDQDNFAKKSYMKAQKAQESSAFNKEIVPIRLNDKKYGKILVAKDEEPTKVDFEKIPTLKPAFEKSGTITAANASTINDGAAAVLLMSENKVKELGINPIAKIISHISYSHEPEWFTTAPVEAIKLVLKKSGLSLNQIGLWEINEAFSCVTMAAIDDLGIDENKVNINGGSVALGHPIGASGARILTTLINALITKKERYGLASLCIGGGEASAMIIENYDSV